MFADRPWHLRLPAIHKYRALFQEAHGRTAPPELIADRLGVAEAHRRMAGQVGRGALVGLLIAAVVMAALIALLLMRR